MRGGKHLLVKNKLKNTQNKSRSCFRQSIVIIQNYNKGRAKNQRSIGFFTARFFPQDFYTARFFSIGFYTAIFFPLDFIQLDFFHRILYSQIFSIGFYRARFFPYDYQYSSISSIGFTQLKFSTRHAQQILDVKVILVNY